MRHKKLVKVGWHKGPPPSIGWWPASKVFDETSVRWWNGTHWSYSFSALKTYTDHHLNFWAPCIERVKSGELIYWMDRPNYWPDKSKT